MIRPGALWLCCGDGSGLGDGPPTISAEGKGFHLSGLALGRQRPAAEFKIEGADVASLDNDLVVAPEGLFGVGGEGKFGGHFPVDADGDPGILAGFDSDDEAVGAGGLGGRCRSG